MSYVIIGNSTAAIGCIEGIRKVDKTEKITVISDEKYHTYSRPLISYLLEGKTNEQLMKYRPDDFYKVNNCDLLLGEKVVKIYSETKEVLLKNGRKIPYKKLLIATGSRAFIPHFNGIEQVKQKCTFMNLDDAKALKTVLKPESKVLIVGAGLIGLKCAEGISSKVSSVDVIDMADRILPSILDLKASQILKKHIEKHNIVFHLSDSISEFNENKAILKSGKTLNFDILVIAVGVRPNVELISEIGGKVNKGILVNSQCQTSISDIYAAGDCTECKDITTGENRVLAVLPNAYFQGETAGLNMAGKETHFNKAIAMNSIGFWGLHIITAGDYNGEEHTIYTYDNEYKKLITKDNLLKGYIMVGNIKNAGIYTRIIRDKIPLDDIDFELIKRDPKLMAFKKSEIKRILGGVV